MRRTFPIKLIPYGIVILLLAVAAMWDYPINATLYDPDNVVGIFFERLILFPITLFVPIAFYARYRVHHRWYLIICYLISCFYVVYDLAHFWVDIIVNAWWIGLLAIIFIAMFTLLLQRVSDRFWFKYERYLTYILVVFLGSMLITVVLKQFWGRVRYREMLDDIMQFTPWYLPQGYSGHLSFPSGHTTAFSVILCSLDCYRIKHSHPPFWWQYVLVFGLIITMMMTRMIVGAHFLSDVTMGFCITYTMFLWMRRYFFREDFI